MPGFTSQADYARHRGVQRNAVSQAIKKGTLRECLVLDANGVKQIGDVELADREWAANTDLTKAHVEVKIAAAARAAPGGPVDPDETPDLAAATERLKSAQADLAELKYAEAAGDLVPRDEVLREWADLLSQVRTKVLGAPTQLKQALPHLTVADVVLIENILREALEDLVTAEAAP